MRSDNVTKGSERAPNRSLFYALGYTKEELERPLIGVVSAYSEIVPGHMNLDKIADAVKAGVEMAGGTPILIPAIGVCDGIAMGHVGMKYSLASRELICDSVETMLMAHQLDGLVRDEQKVFDAMDADETGRYLPFGYRNGVPSPSQKDKRADIAKLNRIQLHLDDLVTQMGQQLYDGQIAAEPLVAGAGRNPCVWCDYSFICCHETGIGERALEAPAKPFEPEETENEKEGEQA